MKSKLFFRLSLWSLTLTLAAFTAAAQPGHTLEIRDGVVSLDGKALPEHNLPDALRIEGFSAQLTFGDGTQAVLVQDGVYYLVEAGGLRVAKPDELTGNHATIMLPGEGGLFQSSWGVSPEEAAFFRGETRSPQTLILDRMAEAMGVRSEALDQLESVLVGQGGVLAREPGGMQAYIAQTDQRARMAQQLVYGDLRTYLRTIQSRDQALFDDLIREQQMEAQAAQLADLIRRLPTGDERDQRIEQLHQILRESFDLKQANRRLEVAQLDSRLRELKTHLEDRARLRDQIIEGRLKELIGALDW